jgi:predicted kinase
LRAPFAAMAHELAVPVAILHLDPPEAVVVQRLLDRQASGRGESDAGVAVYAECKRDFEPPHRGEGAKVIHSDAADLGPEFVARVLAALLAQAEPPATAHASD